MSEKKKGLTYAEAGVDIEARQIKKQIINKSVHAP